MNRRYPNAAFVPIKITACKNRNEIYTESSSNTTTENNSKSEELAIVFLAHQRAMHYKLSFVIAMARIFVLDNDFLDVHGPQFEMILIAV